MGPKKGFEFCFAQQFYDNLGVHPFSSSLGTKDGKCNKCVQWHGAGMYDGVTSGWKGKITTFFKLMGAISFSIMNTF